MSNIQTKRHDEPKNSTPNKTGDVFFYIVAIAVVVLALIFIPKALGASGVSFLAAGSGLNKLLTFIVAAVLGWVCLLPSRSYKSFIDLSKGARTEWRKTIKPDRETVTRTTMMVLALVVLFALLILLLDWVFATILSLVIA